MEKILEMDLSAIERRVVHNFESNVDAALSLPRQHPMRFALLYGCGKDKLRRLALGMAYDMPADRCYAIIDEGGLTPEQKLAAELEIFERWQAGRAGRIRLENAAIAFAAVEAGITSSEERTLTGHRWSAPEPQWIRRDGTTSGRVKLDKPNFEEVTRD